MEESELADYLDDIADHAVRSLIKHTGIAPWVTDQEFNDMKQEAILRMLLVLRRGKVLREQRAYLFVAARDAARAFIFWWQRSVRSNAYFSGDRARNKELRARVRLVSLEALEEAGWQARCDEQPEREHAAEPLPPEQSAALFNIFLSDRKKRGGRGLAAAVRDVRIVNCVVMGYTNHGIAHELQITNRDASHYRLSIRNRLRNYLERMNAA
jgi:hypothetical protein